MAASNINTSLGNYFGPKLKTELDQLISQKNIVLQGQPVLPTDLSGQNPDKYLALDVYGRLLAVDYSSTSKGTPNLHQVTNVGNITDLPIEQAPATKDSELATLGQVQDTIADIINESPEIIQLITNLVEIIQNNDPLVQTILDELNNKVDKNQLGVDVQQLTIQGGERRLPLNQAPLLDLEMICQVGSNQSTRVSGLPAINDYEFVTLLQLQNSIQNEYQDLHSVLGVGNVSSRSIILEPALPGFGISNQINHLGSSIIGPETENRQFTAYYTQNGVTLSVNQSSVIQQATLEINNTQTNPSGDSSQLNRLISRFDSKIGTILTSQDFGHNPDTGLGINQDFLDDLHASDFVTKQEFPVDVTGVISGQTLIFNGAQFIPGTISSGSGLVHFTESTNANTAILSPQNNSLNMHLKPWSYRNFIVAKHDAVVSGSDNFLLSLTSETSAGLTPRIQGNNNFYISNNGNLSGNFNLAFTKNLSVVNGAVQNKNIIFDLNEDLALGVLNDLIENNLIFNLKKINLTPNYAGNNQVLFQNNNITFSSPSQGSNSLISHTDTTTINGNNHFIAQTKSVQVDQSYTSLFNLNTATILGNLTVASGIGINSKAYAQVVFGSFPTNEPGTPNRTQSVSTDRQFVIGQGNVGERLNALTLWKSGQTQLNGQLKIGYSHGNETGSPIEGMLRYNTSVKVLEIFRNSVWTKDLLNVGIDGHLRLHQIDSILDHEPVSAPNRGKFLFTDVSTGQITFVDQPGGGGGLTPVSGILEWQTNVYRPYTIKTASQFYTGETAPDSLIAELNFDGIFKATRLYVGNSSVLTSHPNEGPNGNLHAIANTTHAGFLPQLPTTDQTTKYLRGDGSWAIVSTGGVDELTADELAAINGANNPSADNVFLTAQDVNVYEEHVQIFTRLDTAKSVAELFPPTTIVNQEMDMFIPATTPGIPEVTGTPITITQIDTVNYTITVDFFPYFEGEQTNQKQWLISKSVGTEPSRSGQDQQYAYITSFARTGKGGVITYNPSKVRNIGTWGAGTTIYYVNVTREWDYNLGSSVFKISNNPVAGSWTRSTVGNGGFFRTKNGEIRLVANGYNNSPQQRSVGLAWPTTGDPTGDWTLDSTPRILYSQAPQWCQGSSSGIVITSVMKSPTEDCFIGYFNTYNQIREIGYVKFNEDMSWFQFGESPMITAVGLGAYQPSVIFYNGRYHMTLAELNSDTSPDAGNWTLGHYESVHPTEGWQRMRSIDVTSYRDIKDCYRSSHSTECKMFIHDEKLYSFIDGTSRWNAAGNRGQRNIGLMMYDDAASTWLPYRVGPVFAGYQFADQIWNLPFGHTGSIPGLIIDKDYLYFATSLTQQTDQYKIIISRKKIR